MMSHTPHIGLLAPAAEPVRTTATGSIEALLATLANGLIARGHAVTLFAVGASQTAATLHRTLPRGYDEHDDWWDWQTTEIAHAAIAYAAAEAAGIDVMHAHTPYALPAAAASRIPTVMTHHTEIAPEIAAGHRALPNLMVVCASRSQALGLDPADRERCTIVPHGVEIASWPPSESAEGPLLFLGRLIADKGVAAAIELARRCNRRLVIAGARVEEDEEPGLDGLLAGPHVEYRGAIDAAERDRLLAGAAALVLPLRHEEPFGLVLIEAMACGTPVLTLDVGACREIVENGLTGWVAVSITELVERCDEVVALDRARIRARAAERFGSDQMVDGYLAAYREASRTHSREHSLL
jgi:glycosyltransferase involved in cell wall biosynthesis